MNALVPNGPKVQQLPSSQPVNTYDCGVYVLYHSIMILRFFLRTTSWRAVAMSKQWKQDLQMVKPIVIRRLRSLLRDRSCFSDAGGPRQASKNCAHCGFFSLQDVLVA